MGHLTAARLGAGADNIPKNAISFAGCAAGEKGSYRYFINGRRLPKETLMELFKFLNVLYPRYETITDDLLETDPIEIAEDSFFTYVAPFFRQ